MQVEDKILSIINERLNLVLTVQEVMENKIRLVDQSGNEYELFRDSTKLLDIAKIYRAIKARAILPLMSFSFQGNLYALFPYYSFTGEEYAASIKLLDECIRVHQNTLIPIALKKTDLKSLNAIYQVLDKRFRSLEMQIRGIEMRPIKNDADWIVLSKYYVVLDAKMALYDLQESLFKSIDKGLSLEFGLIHPRPSGINYRSNSLTNYQGSFVGPVSILLARFYVENNHLHDYSTKINSILSDKKESFYATHFKFLVLYIYLIRLEIPVVITLGGIANYLALVLKISEFMDKYLPRKK